MSCQKASEIAQYLRCLAVDEDACHWDDACLARILSEAVQAVAMQRPEYFSDVVQLTPDAAGVISLPDGYSQFVTVQGLVLQGETRPCQSMKMMPLSEANDADPCWRCKDGNADTFVWDAQNDPTRIYPNGTIPPGATVTATVSKCPDAITDLNGDVCVPCHLMPQVIDWALYRMYDRVDTAAGKQSMHYNHWERYGVMALNVSLSRSGL